MSSQSYVVTWESRGEQRGHPKLCKDIPVLQKRVKGEAEGLSLLHKGLGVHKGLVEEEGLWD